MRGSRRSRVEPKADVGSAPGLRKSEKTRKAILDGALEFLWSRPFREMTVAELMSIAGSASAFWGGGPWGGGHGSSNWMNDGMGDGWGDFNMNMSGSGQGRGHNRYNSYYGPYGYGGMPGGYPYGGGYGGVPYGGGYGGVPYGGNPYGAGVAPQAPVPAPGR